MRRTTYIIIPIGLALVLGCSGASDARDPVEPDPGETGTDRTTPPDGPTAGSPTDETPLEQPEPVTEPAADPPPVSCTPDPDGIGLAKIVLYSEKPTDQPLAPLPTLEGDMEASERVLEIRADGAWRMRAMWWSATDAKSVRSRGTLDQPSVDLLFDDMREIGNAVTVPKKPASEKKKPTVIALYGFGEESVYINDVGGFGKTFQKALKLLASLDEDLERTEETGDVDCPQPDSYLVREMGYVVDADDTGSIEGMYVQVDVTGRWRWWKGGIEEVIVMLPQREVQAMFSAIQAVVDTTTLACPDGPGMGASPHPGLAGGHLTPFHDRGDGCPFDSYANPEFFKQIAPLMKEALPMQPP